MEKAYFAHLGLHEGATTKQIDEAYTVRLRKLKSANYDDDLDYARRKINDLEEAYRMAKGGMAHAKPLRTHPRESLGAEKD